MAGISTPDGMMPVQRIVFGQRLIGQLAKDHKAIVGDGGVHDGGAGTVTLELMVVWWLLTDFHMNYIKGQFRLVKL